MTLVDTGNINRLLLLLAQWNPVGEVADALFSPSDATGADDPPGRMPGGPLASDTRPPAPSPGMLAGSADDARGAGATSANLIAGDTVPPAVSDDAATRYAPMPAASGSLMGLRPPQTDFAAEAGASGEADTSEAGMSGAGTSGAGMSGSGMSGPGMGAAALPAPMPPTNPAAAGSIPDGGTVADRGGEAAAGSADANRAPTAGTLADQSPARNDARPQAPAGAAPQDAVRPQGAPPGTDAARTATGGAAHPGASQVDGAAGASKVAANQIAADQVAANEAARTRARPAGAEARAPSGLPPLVTPDLDDAAPARADPRRTEAVDRAATDIPVARHDGASAVDGWTIETVPYGGPAADGQVERAGIIASFILNAAMIPGWPPPRPFDMPDADGFLAQLLRNPKAMPAEEDLLSYLGGDDEDRGVKTGLMERLRALLARLTLSRRMRVLLGLVALMSTIETVLEAIEEELGRLAATRAPPDDEMAVEDEGRRAFVA